MDFQSGSPFRKGARLMPGLEEGTGMPASSQRVGSRSIVGWVSKSSTGFLTGMNTGTGYDEGHICHFFVKADLLGYHAV